MKGTRYTVTVTKEETEGADSDNLGLQGGDNINPYELLGVLQSAVLSTRCSIIKSFKDVRREEVQVQVAKWLKQAANWEEGGTDGDEQSTKG